MWSMRFITITYLYFQFSSWQKNLNQTKTKNLQTQNYTEKETLPKVASAQGKVTW